jgi:hypothetical protein
MIFMKDHFNRCPRLLEIIVNRSRMKQLEITDELTGEYVPLQTLKEYKDLELTLGYMLTAERVQY